jgi:cytoskeletal protein RodZ
MDKQDKIFKKVAENHTSQVDFEDLWSKLEPHVPKKKKDRKFLWIWLSLIGVVMISGVAWFAMHLNTTATNVEKSIYTNSVGSKINDFPRSIKQTNSEPTKSDLFKANKNKSSSSNVATEKRISSNNQAPDFISAEAVFYKIWQENKNYTDKNENSEIYSSFDAPTEFSLKHNGLDTLSHQKILTSGNADSDITRDRKVEEIAMLSMPTLSDTKSVQPVEDFTILPIKPKWFNILVYSGIGRTWVDYSNQKDAYLLQKMNQSEKGMEYFNFGCSIEKKIGNRWSVNAGLRYGRLVSEVKNRSTVLSPIVTDGNTEITIDSLGNESRLTGQVEGYQLKTTTSKWFTYHHQIDLPLSIKYSLFHHQGHRISLSGGIAIPIWMATNGSYYDAEGTWRKVSETGTYLANRLSWQYGVDWEWRLFKNGSIHSSLINETKKYSLKQAPTQSDKNISIWYINLGYRHYF